MNKIEKIKAYKDFLETEAGKIILKDLADFCGYDIDAHTPGDPYETAYVLGRQRVIRRIQNFLNMTDQQLSELVKDKKTTSEDTYDILYNIK